MEADDAPAAGEPKTKRERGGVPAEEGKARGTLKPHGGRPLGRTDRSARAHPPNRTRRVGRRFARIGGTSVMRMFLPRMTQVYRVWEETDLEYPARIKVHNPCRAGVLVELAGEFDVSCLLALAHALRRASGLGEPAFVDLAGVTFMDALCLRELAAATGTRDLVLCRPSWEVMLGVVACGLEESVVVVPDDHPGYEAVIAAAGRCGGARRAPQPGEHHLYVSGS